MEILTYVLEGQLAHTDSLGHTETLRPGEFQRMTAGTGIRHSEFNPSPAEPVHFYQIWIEPDRAGHAPGYEQKRFDDERTLGRLAVVASPDGRDGSLTIQQDALVLLGRLADGEIGHADLEPGRAAWVQVLRGWVELDGHTLEAGDGAAVDDLPAISLRALGEAEVLVFDLA
jgi:redox-sensitive bicupin YhaK (pirin superfamily)